MIIHVVQINLDINNIWIQKYKNWIFPPTLIIISFSNGWEIIFEKLLLPNIFKNSTNFLIWHIRKNIV